MLAFALTAALLPASQHIKRDRSVRSFFEPDHPRLIGYTEVQKDFAGDTLCLAVFSDPDLLTPAGLDRLGRLTRRLAEVPGVLKATSLATLNRPGDVRVLRSLAEWFARRDIDPETLRREILGCDMYHNQFIGPDGQTAAVAMLVDPAYMASGQFTESLRELRQVGNALEHPARIVGAPVMINDVYDYLDQDALLLSTVSSAAMMLVILVLFRTVRWMVLPIVLVQVTLVWTKALLALASIDLSLVGSLTTALITVIGIGTAVHIAIRLHEEHAIDGDPDAALERTLVAVTPAVFWTCATTSAGFGSLWTSRVAPVREFGAVMAAASAFVGIAAFLILPWGALLWRRWEPAPRAVPGDATLARLLGALGDGVTRRPWRSLLITAGVLSFSLMGMARLQVETDFTRNFRQGSSILEGYRFVEERLGGAGFVELAFNAPNEPGPEFLQRLRRCEDQLRAVPGVTKVVSLVDVLDFLTPRSRAISANSMAMVQSIQLGALRLARPAELNQVWNPSRGRMRMLLRVKERQSTEDKALLLERIEEVARENLGQTTVVTGLYVLLVHIISSLLGDQWRAFLVSCAIILAMTTVAFRSVRFGVAGFLPNLIPIAITMGSMGALGFKINVATAMIGSISMGLTVDFSIHYLSRYRDERQRGARSADAIGTTNRSTGKAMVCANIALMTGFGVLMFSNLLPTMQFGLLISVAMFGGLIGNLVLLPILLSFIDRWLPWRSPFDSSETSA